MIKVIKLDNNKRLTGINEAAKIIPSIQKKDKIYIKEVDDEIEVVDQNYINCLLNSKMSFYTVEYIKE